MKTFMNRFGRVLLNLGAFLFLSANAFSATIYSSDFETGLGTEWSLTNVNSEVLDPFTEFSGRFASETQTLTVINLIVDANYSLFFDLCIIDSWDGGSDHFKVDVAGVNHFDHSFYYYNPPANQTYPNAPDVGPMDLGFDSYKDSIYRTIELVFAAVSNVQDIAFYAPNAVDIADESWGIDNVVVQDYVSTGIQETSLPSGAASEAIAWFSITADRALTETTAIDVGNFDLRAAGVDGLFGTGDDTLYGLTPTFDGDRTISFEHDGSLPLQYEAYRFTSSTNVLDHNGLSLDAFVRTFTLQKMITGRLEGLSNDSLDAADSLMPLTESPSASGFLTAHGSGSFSSSTDNDYWKFEAEAGDVITAWVEVDRSDVQPYLNLYNAAGTQLTYANNWTWFSRIQNYAITTPGTYFLMVDPYYNRSPTPSYTLRLDLGRNRNLESEINDTPAQANVLAWELDGSSLKANNAGALVHSDDLFDLGFINQGNAMSVNVRFPTESELDVANLIVSVELDDGEVLYSTNLAVFAYDFVTNAPHYLRLHSEVGGVLEQYVLDLTLLDSVAPFMVSSTLPMDGTTNSAIIDRFSAQFSEYMDVGTATDPTSFRLSSSGVDGVWGNGDDELYPLISSYSENSLTADFQIEAGPLQPERDYRFEANTNLLDRVGNGLGADYQQAFRMEGLSHYIEENRNNGRAALATPLGTYSNVATGAFAFQESMAVGDNPVDVEAIDLTGDAVLDLVVVNLYADQIQIMEGQGEGSFSVLTNLVVGDGPRQVTMGYFNADAYPDLAVANEYSDNVSILLGQGNGMFAPKVDVAAGNGPYDISAGDLNEDGFVDLAVALNNVGQVRVLFGDGAGTFNSSTNYSVGSSPQEIEIADLNGDSKPDVAVVNYNSDTVSILLNTGVGTLSGAVSYPCGDTPRCLSVGDMDNDGSLDLVVGNINADTVQVLLGTGDGSFGSAVAYTGTDGPADLSLKDITGDGFLDVMIASYSGGKLTTLLNSGDGTLVEGPVQHPVSSGPNSLVVEDFNGDGLNDVMMTTASYDFLYAFRGIGWVELSEDPVDSGLRFGAGRGNLKNTGDYDYWSFSAKAGDQVMLAVQKPGNPINAQLRYSLFDPAGTRIGANYSSEYYGSHGQSAPLLIPEDGTYTVEVHYSDYHWGEYRLRVTQVPAGQQLENENNDTLSEANLLDFVVDGNRLVNTVNGYVGVADPKGDLFSLGNLTSGTVVRVDRRQPSNSELSPWVEIVSEDGYPVSMGSNQVLQLDGTATGYAMANPVAQFPTTALTYEFWMRTDDTTKNGAPISYAYSGEDDEALLYNYRNFTPHIHGSYYNTGISANDGRWHHMAWTWDGVTGTSLLYKDGDLVHSNGTFKVGYSIAEGGAFVLGQDQDSVGGGFVASQAFLGLLDEVRVWNTVRSAAEIQSNLYNSLTGNEAGLVSYWNFDDATANDRTAQANDLMMAGDARLIESDLKGDPASSPSHLEFTTPADGIYYIHMQDAAGIGDLLNQYQIDVSLEDHVVPYISGTTLPLAGSVSDVLIDQFSISFSEEMDRASVSNPAHYDLRSAGSDGLFNTSDDAVYGLNPAYASGLEASFEIMDGPLQPGAIRLTVFTGVLDRIGQALNAVYVHEYSYVLRSGFVVENRNNGSVGLASSMGYTTTTTSDGSFVIQSTQGVGDGPYGVVLADFNGDLILDSAVVNYYSDTLSVLLGVGDGTFLSETNIAVGDAPTGVTAGLVNGDAFFDLVTVNRSSGTATVLLGDGSGGFTTSGTYAAGSSSRDVVLSDLNNDGHLDLITANESADSVSVLLGAGDGTFATAIHTACGDAPYGLAVGDIDGDGSVDIAVANYNADSLGILFGNGDGSLQAVGTYAAGDGARSVAMADLNADGKMDLAVANHLADTITIFHGLENGVLTNHSTWAAGDAPAGSLICADMDLDGDLDLAVANYNAQRTSVLLQGPAGSFSERMAYYDENGAPYPIDIDFGDLNGDGLGDFVVANHNADSMSVFLGNPQELLVESPVGSGLFSAFGYGNLHDVADIDYWSFSGQAGDVVTVACEIPAHPYYRKSLSYGLYDPSGTRLTYFYGETSSGYGQSLPITLSAGGRYTVRVDNRYAFYGEYNVAVQVARAPLQPESEANNSVSTADEPIFSLNAGQSEAQVCAFMNSGGITDDYYSLGNLPSGTVVQVSMAFPAMSELVPDLKMVDASGTVLAISTNQMLSLDGSYDYMSHTTTGIDPRNGTVEGWVYPKESTDWGFWQTRPYNETDRMDQIAAFAWQDNPSTFYYRTGNGASGTAQDITFGTTNYIPAYTWSHLAFTWGESNLNVYVNGSLIASRNDAVLQDVMNPIACLGIGDGRWLNGWMDEFRIWDRPLNKTEINTYKDQSLTGSESGLVAYWDFDGTTLDASANGNDGELFNQATLIDKEYPGELASYPTNFTFTTPASGAYYVRVGAALGSEKLTSQYILNLSTYDSTVPYVVSDSLPMVGTTNELLFNTFSVTFSEEMAEASLSLPGQITLVGTSDETAYTLAVDYTGGATASFEILDGPLRPDDYRFTISSQVTDRSGTALMAYTNTFTVARAAGYRLESSQNGDDDLYTSLNGTGTNLLDGTFTLTGSQALGDGPLDMVSGFIDSDTFSDLVVVNYAEHTVSVLLGSGTNTFNLSTNLTVGTSPRAVAMGLIDDDSHLDLAVVSSGSDSVNILLGNGAGGFANSGTYAVGDNPYDVVLGDFDGDDDLDLATVNVGSDSMSILLGSGDGTFGLNADTSIDNEPEHLVIADLNQDGILDLVVASRSDGTVHLFEGQGNGTFVNSTNVVVGIRADALASADLNLDGFVDLACLDYGADCVAILMADGAGGFQSLNTFWTGDGPMDLDLRDLNGDVAPDLIVVNRSSDTLAVLYGNGYGEFSAPVVTSVEDDPVALCVEDFDRDGNLDVAMAHYNTDILSIVSPNTMVLLSEEYVDGSVRQQRGYGTMTSESDVDNWTFFAAAGDQLVLGMDVPDHSGYYNQNKYEIYDPDGVRVLSLYSDAYGYGESQPLTLSMSGSYRLRVTPYRSYYGEYRFRVTTVSPPVYLESEENHTINLADRVEFIASAGQLSAWMAGSIEGNDTYGDYFNLGNLDSGTEINLLVEFPQLSTLIPSLELFDPSGTLVASESPATNLAFTTTVAGDYFVRINDVVSSRGLDALYRLAITLSDSTAPTVEAVLLPEDGDFADELISSFDIIFSEGMDVASASRADNYELLCAGVDGLFGTGDDELYALDGSEFDGGAVLSLNVVQSPLQAGKYRFTMGRGITDRMGNSLVLDVVRTFELGSAVNRVYESRENDSPVTATALVLVDNPDGLRIGDARGSLQDGTDIDYYAFTASTNETLVLGIDQLVYASAQEVQYRVVDSNGNLILELLSNYSTQRGQTAPFSVPTNGTYYIRVSSYRDFRGEYQIRILAATDPVMLETEANDDLASANLLVMQTAGITNSASVAGYVAHEGDNDYYEMGFVTNDMTILVGVRVPTNSLLVPAVSVYDASGSYMPEEGSTGDGSAEVRITASNRYFVVVRGAESTGGFGQDYMLDTEILPTGAVIIPNLRVTQVTLPIGGGPESGDTLSISYAVENVGSAATEGGAWLDRVVLSRNKIMGDSDDYPLGSYAHSGDLNAGAAYTNQISVNLPDGIDGSFYVVVYTDFADQVDERLFDGDNASASAITFSVALAAYPDLRVENLTLAGSNEVGQVLSIDWNTANRGVEASGTFSERVRIIRTDTGADLLNQTFVVSGPIGVNAVIPHSLSFTTTVGVAHQVMVTTDSADEVFEYSDSHSIAEQNTVVESKPIAYFYDVVVAASPEVGGSVMGGGHWPAGSIITVDALVNTNQLPYTFVNWTEQGGFRSAASSYTFLLTQSRNLHANFILPQFNLSVARLPEAGGSISGAGSFDYASTNVVQAYVNPGYRFDHWMEGAVDLGSATSLTNVMLNHHALTAYFAELNPFHDVVTSTEPIDVATVIGAGHYTNGTTAVFSAPQMPTNSTTRFLFQRLELNGGYLTTSSTFTNTFSTLQPSNMTVVARYTEQPIEPQVLQVMRNVNDPVPATTNFVVELVFDRSMNPVIEPLVLFSNTVDQSTFVASSNGVWESTSSSNDTYTLLPISWESGMDGDYAVLISQATDLYSETMGLTNALMIEVNSTPPENPLFSVVSSNAISATLEWAGYTAPSDLDGFRLYRETSEFSNVWNLAPVQFLSKTSLGAVVNGIELDTDYYLAAAAVDVAGNMDSAVTGRWVRVDSVVPPAVQLSATGQGADRVLLSWDGYDTTGLFGLEGFEIYSETSDFSDVTTLTPIRTVDASADSLLLEHLDRRFDHSFAVVGFNGLGQKVTAVTTVSWSDPYAGLITNNLAIDGDFEIYRDITVAEGAVLTLEPGTSLRFQSETGLQVDGTLMAEGTVFDPITLTSSEASPDRGDWNGLVLGSTASASSLSHVWVMYGHGIQLDGCAPTATALSVLFNASSGLSLVNDAALATEDLLAQYNAVGLIQADSSVLSVNHSIVLNNDINAFTTGSSPMLASHVWWGSTHALEVASGLAGTVSASPYLVTEPLLTPAADTLDGLHDVGTRTVAMKYACRIAESFRVSEDSSFAGAFFHDFVATNSVLLSEGGGNKTLYIQYRNVNGETNAPIVLPLNYITDGPTFQSLNLSEGQQLERPYVIDARSSSPLGVAASEFYVDDVLVASTNGGVLSVLWDIRDETEGVHRIKFLTRDPQDAFSTQVYNVWISHVPPPAPVWIMPTTGTVTSASSISVSGTAEPGISVQINRNSIVVADVIADPAGQFNAPNILLVEGDNQLVASAYDVFGSGTSSRRVVCDTGNPETVILESVAFDPLGGVYLEWRNRETGEVPTHYKVYGNTVPFNSAAEALGSSEPVTTLSAELKDLADAHYWFAVVGIDGAGNESELSNMLEVNYDTVPPAFTIGYNRSSPVGAGMLHVVLHASEVLRSTPDLLITPNGASGPVMLALESTGPDTFEGDLNLFSSTLSGLAQVRISAVDLAGNVFNEAPEGMELWIDTTPPTGSIETDLHTLVQVQSNVTLNVSLSLSELPKAGTVPQLVCNPPSGASLNIPLSGNGLIWSGLVQLNPLMGSGLCQFDLSVVDALNNEGTEITSGATLEIYNTALPEPPAIPRLVNPVAQKDGRIYLVWYPVEKAEQYNLYRLAGSNGIPTVVTAGNLMANAWTDLPPEDGFYRYAVTALRRGAESDLSTIHTEYSDRTPPGAPTNMVVQLKTSGVEISWEAPSVGDYPIRYTVYRDEQEIGSMSALSPTLINDYPPRGTSVYTVASSDWVGNEAFSSAHELVMNVPAVESFEVLLHEDQPPALSWKMGDSEIVGVNLYRNGVKLNDAPLTDSAMVDAQYAGSALVEYALKSVNSGGAEGPARRAQVHRLDFNLSVNRGHDGYPLMNYFDRYDLTLTNQTVNSVFALDSVELRRTFVGGTALEVVQSENQSVDAGGNLALNVPMSSMVRSEAQTTRIRLVQTPDASGASVAYQRLFDFGVAVPDTQMVEIGVTNQLVAGSLGQFKVRLFNRSLVDMDVVLVRDGGAAPGDVYLVLKNALGDEVSRGTFQSSLPEIQMSVDGRGYVTVAADSYFDLWITDLLVPEALAENGVVEIEAGAMNIFHRLGEEEEQVSGPVSASVVMALAESPYYGSAITDSIGYSNDEIILISGQAIRRSDDEPLPNSPLRIGFAQGSFRWYEEVTTDENGSYALTYTIPQGLSGTISIWAAHPEVYDRLDQVFVRVYRLYCLPQFADVRMSKNSTVDADITLYNPGNEPLTDLALSVRTYRMDGTNEVAITSISAQSLWEADLELPPGERVRVPFRIQSDLDAPDVAVIELAFHSVEGASATLTGTMTLLEAVPVVDVVEPSVGYVDLSLNRGKVVTRTVTIANHGVRDLKGVTMTLPEAVDWMVPNLPVAADGLIHLPDLPVGSSNTFDMVFMPPEGVALDHYQDTLVISGTNHLSPFSVYLYATVSSAEKGDLQFYVQNTLSLPVPEASIRLSNRLLGVDLAPLKTGTNGLLVVKNLQEGYWNWRIDAAGHSSAAGLVEVMPDQTMEVESRLNKELVTVRFSVVPVPFTDRYEIKIEQLFETHVPMPVLVVDPMLHNFAYTASGLNTRFNVTARNHGLIALNDFTIEGNYYDWGELTPMITYLPRLNPQEEVLIPYKFTMYTVQDDVDGESQQRCPGGSGSGGGSDSGGGGGSGVADAIGNFGGNLHAAISHLAGGAKCPGSLDESTAHKIVAAVSILKAVLDSNPESALEASIGNSINDIVAATAGSTSRSSGPDCGEAGHIERAAVCFALGTDILLEGGTSTVIETLKVGDVVRCGSKPTDLARVAEIITGRSSRWVEVSFENGRTLTVTEEHLIWLDRAGWTPAHRVQPGDYCFMPDGRRIAVTKILRTEEDRPLVSVRLHGEMALYANGIMVHDQCGRWTPVAEESKGADHE